MAVLILLATAVVVVGVSIEKAEEGEHAKETLFGIETESTALVILGVVCRRRGRGLVAR